MNKNVIPALFCVQSINRIDSVRLYRQVYGVRKEIEHKTEFLIHDGYGWLWVDSDNYEPIGEEFWIETK